MEDEGEEGELEKDGHGDVLASPATLPSAEDAAADPIPGNEVSTSSSFHQRRIAEDWYIVYEEPKGNTAHGTSQGLLTAATSAPAALTAGASCNEAPNFIMAHGTLNRPLATVALTDEAEFSAAAALTDKAPKSFITRGASRWPLPAPTSTAMPLDAKKWPGMSASHTLSTPLTATSIDDEDSSLPPRKVHAPAKPLNDSVVSSSDGEISPSTLRRPSVWTERSISPPIAGGFASSDHLCSPGRDWSSFVAMGSSGEDSTAHITSSTARAAVQNSAAAISATDDHRSSGEPLPDLFFGRLLKQVNTTILALIPKVRVPSLVSDFRPISCCNVLYKVITKIIVQRLRSVLDKMISPSQNAFVPAALLGIISYLPRRSFQGIIDRDYQCDAP
ncbi:hypothetical protein Sango_3002800 [Sesamum angolense]|uniref:Reverse transcriptase n=1 Tax=Sesamum angolense TaxID=2727404 RepID=A0AAE1T4J2_9LAMI|nr:hypothetical protein Sango_3002800 [Sesamum angolense]